MPPKIKAADSPFASASGSSVAASFSRLLIPHRRTLNLAKNGALAALEVRVRESFQILVLLVVDFEIVDVNNTIMAWSDYPPPPQIK